MEKESPRFKSLVLASNGNYTNLIVDGKAFMDIKALKYEHIGGSFPTIDVTFDEIPIEDTHLTSETMLKYVNWVLGLGENIRHADGTADDGNYSRVNEQLT